LCRLRGTKQSNLHSANLGIALQKNARNDRGLSRYTLLRKMTAEHLDFRLPIFDSIPHADFGGEKRCRPSTWIFDCRFLIAHYCFKSQICTPIWRLPYPLSNYAKVFSALA